MVWKAASGESLSMGHIVSSNTAEYFRKLTFKLFTLFQLLLEEISQNTIALFSRNVLVTHLSSANVSLLRLSLNLLS